jgi:hypothetical protein
MLHLLPSDYHLEKRKTDSETGQVTSCSANANTTSDMRQYFFKLVGLTTSNQYSVLLKHFDEINAEKNRAALIRGKKRSRAQM